MSDSKERLDAMKNYCDRAVKLEREDKFWKDLVNKAKRKMIEYKNKHNQLDRVILESQTQLTALGGMSRQLIEQKSAEIKKYKKRCRASAIVIFLILFGAVLGAGAAGMKEMDSAHMLQSQQRMVLIVSMLFGLLTFLSLPLIICTVVFVLNKSRQNHLKREISENALDNEQRRKKAILQDQLEKAEKEKDYIGQCEQVLVRQKRELEVISKEAETKKERFYAQGELPKGYQNLEAVISFFYYLDNKIVNEIDGADGMYNKYHLDCQHKEKMTELRGIRHAIEEHERHEQMRHRELMGMLGFYGTVIAARLGQIGSDVRDIRNIQKKIWD